jgi:hypothetical protein
MLPRGREAPQGLPRFSASSLAPDRRLAGALPPLRWRVAKRNPDGDLLSSNPNPANQCSREGLLLSHSGVVLAAWLSQKPGRKRLLAPGRRARGAAAAFGATAYDPGRCVKDSVLCCVARGRRFPPKGGVYVQCKQSNGKAHGRESSFPTGRGTVPSLLPQQAEQTDAPFLGVAGFDDGGVGFEEFGRTGRHFTSVYLGSAGPRNRKPFEENVFMEDRMPRGLPFCLLWPSPSR